MTAVAFERDDWRKYLNYRKRLPKPFQTVNGWALTPEKEEGMNSEELPDNNATNCIH